jgi:serine/threonine protein kinase
MAVVHLARDTHLDRTVALKELNVLGSEHPDMAKRFVREARLSGSLGHSSIVHVNDFFEHDGTPFIAMEYLAGGSLRPHVGHMTFAQIVGVLEGVLDALDHAEQQGIVHRDLKPENVLVAPDGRVKIADFGIAKAINRVNASGFLTATGTAIGTPPYMAPEQGMARDIGPWTDLYAVGCMTHEFFTGRLPFMDPDDDEAAPMAILVRRISEPAPPVRTFNDCVPEALAAWIDGLLVADPTARTRSAAIAWDQLEDIVIDLVGARRRRTARLPLRAVEHAVDPVAITSGASRSASSGAQHSETSPEGIADHGVDPRVSPEHGDPRPEVEAATSLATPPPDDAVAGPHTPPPGGALPGPDTPPPELAVPDAIPGPYTPPPDDAIPGPPLPEDEFVTFRPPAEGPADRTDEPIAAPPAAVSADRTDEPIAAPPDEAPADRADQPIPVPPSEGAADSPDEGDADRAGEAVAPAEAQLTEDGTDREPRYETYREPPPVRPPTEPEPEPSLHPEPEPKPEPAPMLTPDAAPEPEPALASEPAPEPPPPPTPPAVTARGTAADLGAAVTIPPHNPPPRTEPDDTAEAGGAPDRRGRGGWIAAGVGVVALLALLGYLLAPSRLDRVPVEADKPIASGGLKLSVPVGWRQTKDAAPTGLDLQRPITQRPPRAARGEAVLAGFTDTREASLLPPEYVSSVTNRRIQAQPVELPAGTALRYSRLRKAGSSLPSTVYALPTSAGVATLVCQGAAGSQVDKACGAIAETLKADGAHVYSPPPRDGYARAVNPVLSRLAADEATIGARLKAATSPKRLATRLGDLGDAYQRAAQGIGKVDAAPFERDATDAIQARLKRLETLYITLADAARRRQRSRYRTTSGRIERAHDDFRRSVRALEPLGYKLTTEEKR